LNGCGITPDTIDVHGRPYLLYAAQHTADLSYVDLEPAKGTNKDQVLVHHLVDGHADRLTRFITVDYPSGQVSPVKNPDGSYTEAATIDGEEVTFSARTDHGDTRTTAATMAPVSRCSRTDGSTAPWLFPGLPKCVPSAPATTVSSSRSNTRTRTAAETQQG
jgi:hypothetical protein